MNEASPYVIPFETEHAQMLVENLRASDLQEIQAMTDAPVEEVMLHSCSGGDYIRTIMFPGNTIGGIFGVGEVIQGLLGAVWLLGTPALDEKPMRLLRHSRHYVDIMNNLYPILFNYVDARNLISIRWLMWCGFTMIKYHERMGVQHLPFYEFARIK